MRSFLLPGQFALINHDRAVARPLYIDIERLPAYRTLYIKNIRYAGNRSNDPTVCTYVIGAPSGNLKYKFLAQFFISPVIFSLTKISSYNAQPKVPFELSRIKRIPRGNIDVYIMYFLMP